MAFPIIPYRWRIVALLFFLSVLNYLDRQALSVLAPTLRATFGFSTVEYSYIVATFLVAYTIGYVFCGAVIDRIGVRMAVVAALAMWSVAGMLHALATGWITLALCRFLLGLGESFNAPSGMKAIAEWIPKRERGLCTAIFSNGNIVGAIIAPPFVAFVALRYGWQWGFLATGLLGFFYLIFWLKYYSSPDVQPRLSAAERDYLAADVGGPGGGALSDWLVRRGWTPVKARRRMLLVAACIMPLAVVAVHATSAAVALGLIAVLLAAQSCWNTNLLTMMSETFPREQVATFVALSGIGGSIGGILSTLLAGTVIHRVGYVPVFTCLGFLHLTAYFVITLRALPRTPSRPEIGPAGGQLVS